MLHVEIVYALAQRSIVKALCLQPGASVGDALSAAAADENFQGLDLANATVGIFGKVTARDQALKDGDRIEVYRPLLEEPKLARRKRASRNRSLSSKSGRS